MPLADEHLGEIEQNRRKYYAADDRAPQRIQRIFHVDGPPKRAHVFLASCAVEVGASFAGLVLRLRVLRTLRSG